MLRGLDRGVLVAGEHGVHAPRGVFPSRVLSMKRAVEGEGGVKLSEWRRTSEQGQGLVNSDGACTPPRAARGLG